MYISSILNYKIPENLAPQCAYILENYRNRQRYKYERQNKTEIVSTNNIKMLVFDVSLQRLLEDMYPGGICALHILLDWNVWGTLLEYLISNLSFRVPIL